MTEYCPYCQEHDKLTVRLHEQRRCVRCDWREEYPPQEDIKPLSFWEKLTAIFRRNI
ncbi:TPA: hypothetical protein HA241_04655 [Candidatus Woesearchaeota archaeon]|nr:hypothetical protein [Candidatus Woesearchaeota archaeon]